MVFCGELEVVSGLDSLGPLEPSEPPAAEEERTQELSFGLGYVEEFVLLQIAQQARKCNRLPPPSVLISVL